MNWIIYRTDGRTIEVKAVGFRVEHGALVLLTGRGEPSTAWAPGVWAAITPAPSQEAATESTAGMSVREADRLALARIREAQRVEFDAQRKAATP